MSKQYLEPAGDVKVGIDRRRAVFTEEHENAYRALQPRLLKIIAEWEIDHNTPEWSYETMPGQKQLARVHWKTSDSTSKTTFVPIILPLALAREGGSWQIGWANKGPTKDPKFDLAERLIDVFLEDPVLKSVLQCKPPRASPLVLSQADESEDAGIGIPLPRLPKEGVAATNIKKRPAKKKKSTVATNIVPQTTKQETQPQANQSAAAGSSAHVHDTKQPDPRPPKRLKRAKAARSRQRVFNYDSGPDPHMDSWDVNYEACDKDCGWCGSCFGRLVY